MSWNFERVAGKFGFTEGPVWDGKCLLFSDIPHSRILRYDPMTKNCAEYRSRTNEGNGLTLDKQGRLYCCEGGSNGRRVARYENDGSVTVIADRFERNRLNSPNDLVFDKLGRLWFTDPRYGDKRDDMELNHESVYRCDPSADGNWEIRRMTFDTTRPNGLVISPDHQTLYVAQSEYGEYKKRELRAYPIVGEQGLGRYDTLHNFYPHRGIDGMTVDIEGNIVATAGWEVSGPGGMIYVFTPKGRVLETHPVPCNRPTNCAFGDGDLRTLYVTGDDGCLYAARTERKGFPPGRY